MKLKYPAEAFALGIALFSVGMKASFIGGILILLAVVFAEFLKNLLEPFVPDWSLKACVLIGTGAVSASAFQIGFTEVGIPVAVETWLLALIIGLFAAKHVLTAEIQAEYGELFWESAMVWGIWILLAATREFLGAGRIFAFQHGHVAMQSRAFLEMYFGFFTAGLTLAIANGILKKKCTDTNGLLLLIPLVVLARPFFMQSFGEIAGIIWTVFVPIVMFISVRETLKFSRTGKAFRGLPAELLSMGMIYMILSIF